MHDLSSVTRKNLVMKKKKLGDVDLISELSPRADDNDIEKLLRRSPEQVLAPILRRLTDKRT